jgi:hypothetical protein
MAPKYVQNCPGLIVKILPHPRSLSRRDREGSLLLPGEGPGMRESMAEIILEIGSRIAIFSQVLIMGRI